MKNAHLLSEENRPAPGDLRYVQGLLNTLDVEYGLDRLADTSLAAAWLERFGLVAKASDIGDHEAVRLRAFREAVRTLLIAHDGERSIDEAGRALADITADVALGVRFGVDGTVALESRSSGIDGAIGTLVVAILAGAASGEWQRLKVCARDACQWAFYDSSKNRSSNWCSMQTCGNREKVARHRHKAATSA